jgi:hypothetical protein
MSLSGGLLGAATLGTVGGSPETRYKLSKYLDRHDTPHHSLLLLLLLLGAY